MGTSSSWLRSNEPDRGAVPKVQRDAAMGCRVIVATALATLYVAACLAALWLVLSMWSPPL